MITDATIETFAAPPTPWPWTASAMNGTVALAVPPISTGLRPSAAITGAVRMDVKTPSTGGSPISEAIARPYGSAISAAIAPPEQSPRNPAQPYPFAPSRHLPSPEWTQAITLRNAVLNLFISSCVPIETRT